MKKKPALIITEKAKGNKFVDCKIDGAEIRGKDTIMIRTSIKYFKRSHPFWFYSILTTLAIGLILLFIEYGWFVN